MNNKEAIKWINAIKEKYIFGGDEDFDQKRKCALDLAIKALERPQVVLFAENTTEEEKQKLVAELKAVMDKAKLTAEPERTKGEWKPFNSYYRKCDKCERMVGFDYADPEHGNWFNYCPNCGAQMIGGAEHEHEP